MRLRVKREHVNEPKLFMFYSLLIQVLQTDEASEIFVFHYCAGDKLNYEVNLFFLFIYGRDEIIFKV